LFSCSLPAQKPAGADTINPAIGNETLQLEKIKENKVKLHSDSTGNEPLKSVLIDTTVMNKYGDLLNDDTAYNKKYHLWIPVAELLCIHTLTWSMDRFGINFIGHPYSGTLTFNAARSNGYNFFNPFHLHLPEA
jgi:hypothetical protein